MPLLSVHRRQNT